jgi:hypothetical protein
MWVQVLNVKRWILSSVIEIGMSFEDSKHGFVLSNCPKNESSSRMSRWD